MASDASLKLFPSASRPLPRKSSMKKPQSTAATASPSELKGLALQVTSGPGSFPRVLPASDQVKHSLFCEPPTATWADNVNATGPRRQKSRRRHSRPDQLALDSNASHSVDEDQLSPLPINTRFGSNSPPQRHPAAQFQKPAKPKEMRVDVREDAYYNDDDQLSPLPSKTQFTPVSPKSSEYPFPLSERSASPSVVRSNSAVTSRAPSSPQQSAAAMRSMFPRYDHSKPLNAQSYYPSVRQPVQSLPSEKVSKVASPVERPALQRFGSVCALVDGYEHIPKAQDMDLRAIWDASNSKFPVAGRKVQLGLHQSKEHGTSLVVGSSFQKPLYSMDKALPQSPKSKAKYTKHVAVEKHSPQGGSPVLVAQLGLPDPATSESKTDTNVTVIFPQTAAINAIAAVANSPAAAEIATFDPTAASPEAARLAQDAVAEAHRRHACDLVRTTRKRDSLGAVTASYALEHPSLGALPITVTKSNRRASRQTAKAKISLHHPSATPAAVAAETLVLAFLDFSLDACVVDVPGLLALDSPYIIDTAISALLAVAAIENDRLVVETVTFAPPPTAPVVSGKKGKKSDASRKWSRRSSKAIDKMQRELVGQPADVGAPIQGVVAVIGLSLKAGVYLLEASVRVTARVVVGVAHMVERK